MIKRFNTQRLSSFKCLLTIQGSFLDERETVEIHIFNPKLMSQFEVYRINDSLNNNLYDSKYHNLRRFSNRHNFFTILTLTTPRNRSISPSTNALKIFSFPSSSYIIRGNRKKRGGGERRFEINNGERRRGYQ